MKYSPLLSVAACCALLTAGVSAQTTFEDFEMLPLSPGGTEFMGANPLDENSIIAGQGPGLVEDGCVYTSSSSGLWLYGAGYFGVTPSQSIASSGSGSLWMDYDTPVTFCEFEVYALTGFPDVIDVHAYDSGGALISSHTAVVLTDSANPVTLNFSAADIAAVEVTSNTYHWTPFFDNHEFGNLQTGPTLTVLGTCGQPGSGVEATNMTPGGTVGFAASPSNAGTMVPAGPCGTVAIDLGQPLFVVGMVQADVNGVATVLPGNGIPSVACGWYMQAFDMATCTASNLANL